MKLCQHVSEVAITSVLRTLLTKHCALRLKFFDDDQKQQLASVVNNEPILLTYWCSKIHIAETLWDASDALLKLLDIATGKVFATALVTISETNEQYLIFVANHLVIDAVSWHVLLMDLTQLLADHAATIGPLNLPQSHSLQQWSNALLDWCKSVDAEKAHIFWKKQLAPLENYEHAIQQNFRCSNNTIEHKLQLTQSQTSELKRLAATLNVRFDVLLLAAFWQVFHQHFTQHEVLLAVEGHGRETDMGQGEFAGIDLSHTVGWFTSLFPVLLSNIAVSHCAQWLERIIQVQQQLQAMPYNGLAFSTLGYNLNNIKPRILFNYLGQHVSSQEGTAFEFCDASFIPEMQGDSYWPFAIDLITQIVDGQLQVLWLVNAECNEQYAMQQFAKKYMQQLVDYSVQAKSFGHHYCPLTPLQYGILSYALDRDQAVYQTQVRFELSEQVDLQRFQDAWQYVIAQHDILRAAIVIIDKQPCLQIAEDIELDWQIVENVVDIKQFYTTEQQHALDLTRPGLYRFKIVSLSRQRRLVIWTHHHIILDGWSIQQILAEVQAVYSKPNHPAMEVDYYYDYVRWLQLQPLDQAENYWRKQLLGIEPAIHIETLMNHSESVSDHNNNVETLSGLFPSEVFADLNVCAKQLNITMNTILQFTFARLLATYCHRDDVVFATTVSGRHAVLENMASRVGLFIQTLPVRVKFTPDAALSEILQQLHHQLLEANEFSYLGLAKIKQQSGLAADEAMLHYLFVFENYPNAVDDIASLQFENLQGTDHNHFPLTLLIQSGAQLGYTVRYQSQYFSAELVSQIMSSYQTILQQLPQLLDQQVRSIRVIDEETFQKHVYRWNATTVNYHADSILTSPLAHWAKLQPNDSAVTYQDVTVTYQQFEQVTNQLARYIQAHVDQQQKYVGVFMQRSEKLPIVLWAIVKAGLAYVPIDPDYPAARIEYVLQDSKVKCVIVDAQLEELFTHSIVNFNDGVRCITTAWEDVLTTVSEAPLTHQPNPQDPAYVIYTSGSTGQPKGVIVSHQAVSNRLQWMQRQFQLQRHGSVLQKTPYSFDVSVWELFWPLREGAHLIMAKPGGHKDPYYLQELIAKKAIQFIHFVPSMLEVFIAAKTDFSLTSLCAVICSGESLQARHVNAFKQRFTATLFNLYGPTEAAIDVTCYECVNTLVRPAPIGRPISNMQCYVLDPLLQPVPNSVLGELYLGGVGLAQGYLNKPELTAERFITHEVDKNTVKRLYKTGDKVAYRANGEIEYIGRFDGQVKVNGHRIELGEIEAVLSGCDTIKSAAVIAKKFIQHTALIAYVVPDPQALFDKQHVLSQCAVQLPEYMIPKAIISLPSLPITASGKLDRNTLVAMDHAVADDAKQEMPRDAVERCLHDAWCAVLNLEKISIHANFFRLGGHSIALLQLITKLYQQGYRLSLPQCFQNPTIVKQAKIIKAQDISLIANFSASTESPDCQPLSSAQKGIWFMEKIAKGRGLYNIYSMMKLTGELNIDALHFALRALIAQHDALRTAIVTEQGLPVNVVYPTVSLPFYYDETSYDALGYEQAQIKEVEQVTQFNFDLTKAPLMMVRLVRVAKANSFICTLILHHILADEGSITLMLQQLQDAYCDYCRGQRQLPKRQIAQMLSYRSTLQETLDKEMATANQFWQDYLAHVDFSDILPTNARPKIPDYYGQTITTELSIKATNFLRHVAREMDATLYQVMMAFFAKTLLQISDRPQIVLGATASGRDDPMSQDVFGLLVRTFPVVLNKVAEDNINLLIQQLQMALPNIYQHNIIGLDAIIEAASLPRSLNRNPLFQILFEFHGLREHQFSLPNVTTEWIYPELNIAKFDLTLTVVEQQQTILLRLEYATTLYEQQAMQSLLEQIVNTINCELEVIYD